MSKRLVTVFEYSKAIFDPLSSAEARELNICCAELNKHARGEVLSIVHNRSNETIGVVAKQYVGVVRVNKDFVIQILPKMAADENRETANQQSIQNLLFMLSYCNKLQAPHASASTLKTFRGDFFEILIYLFTSSLQSEIRNSLHHEYIAMEQNLPYLRGKLLFSEHVRQNSITQNKFFLRSDEFTIDNPLNRIFKAVCSQLVHSSRNVNNKRRLSELSLMFDEVSPAHIELSDAEVIQLNRLTTRFEPALELAKLFLSGRSLQLQHNTFQTMTFLIDMNVLFEEFIATALRQALPEDLILHTQGPKRYLVTSQSELNVKKEANVFQMKPDISIAYRDRPQDIIQIIDTKYKILDDSEKKMGVSQADMYQMYAYAHKYTSRNITLLYPTRYDQVLQQKSFYTDDDRQIDICIINLQRELRTSMKSLKEELLDIVYATATRY